jgi:hypothetical protein
MEVGVNPSTGVWQRKGCHCQRGSPGLPGLYKAFEVYTDASTMQLGTVVTQDNRPITFFSRKLSGAQAKYSVTKIELLAIVETLKEF